MHKRQHRNGDYGVLQLKNIRKKYHKKIAVDDISLMIHKGDVWGLIGANGAGKSTTISMMATLLKPDEGDILYDGISIVRRPKEFRKILGLVPQDLALYEELTGMDNLIFWGRAYKIPRAELKNRMLEIIEIIGLDETILKGKVKQYSGGMKRRLNIGVALLHHPDVVIMDEPTVGIDIISRNRILEAIHTLRERGTTVIYTGHYMEEMEQICNQICIMEAGKIIISGEKESLLQQGKNSLEKFYLSTIS